jgi:phosphomannomutase
VRADYRDGFGLIRASNTTPVLVLRFEGHTPEALKRIESAFMERCASSSPTPGRQAAHERSTLMLTRRAHGRRVR